MQKNLKQYHQKSWSSISGHKTSLVCTSSFILLKLQLPLPQLFKQVNKYLLSNQFYGIIPPQSYGHCLVFHSGKFVVSEWNIRHWKLNKIVLFWSSEKWRKRFSKIDNIVKYDFKKWILSHPYVIQHSFANDYIMVKLYDRNGWAKTELHQKVILQVSVRGTNKEMQKKDDTGFSMAYDEKGIVYISDSVLQLILPQ